MFTFPITHFGDSDFLDGVFGVNAIADFDATIDLSVDTSDRWINLISDNSVYDMRLGLTDTTDGDEPTLTGSGADRYWLFDSGDIMEMVAANTTLLKKAPRSDDATVLTVALTGQTPSSLANFGQWGLGGLTTTEGFRIFNASSGANLGVATSGDSDSQNTSTASSTPHYSTSSDYLLIVSLDQNNDQFTWWFNGSTGTSETLTVVGGSTADITSKLQIGGVADIPFFNNHRLYSFALFDIEFTDANAANYISHIEARHGRDYTP